MSEKINYAAVALYAFLIVAAVLAVLYFLNTPVKPAFNAAWAWFNEKVHGINFGSFDFGKLISEHITEIVTAGVGGLISLATLWSLNKKKKENEELLESYQQLDAAKLTAESKVNGLTTTVSNQAQELEMYAQDKTAEALQGRIDEMKRYVEDKELEFKIKEDNLRQQIGDLNARLEKEIATRPKEVVTKVT